MKRVYLDNGSTSFPKAPGVSKAICNFIENVGANVNRGGYSDAYEAEDVIIETREKLCKLFGFDSAKNVIFTPSITYSLNSIIKGFLKPGDHVIVSSMEHNAVMRPVNQMAGIGVEFDRCPCREDGTLILEELEGLIKPNTRAVIMLHASNVCGTLMPIEMVGEICEAHNLKFVVDAAQTAGVFPIDMKAMHIDALAFTGHKSLLGPQGIGGFIITSDMAQQMTPLISGGTGSSSDSEIQPEFLPDKFEPGTLNIPGIYGLKAALSYLEEEGIDNIRARELELTERFMAEADGIEEVTVLGTRKPEGRAPVISLDFKGRDNAEIAFLLESQFGVSTRCGLHCSPSAHKTMGTFPRGTLRFSISHKNTLEEILYAIEAIRKVIPKVK